jgi:DNA-binding NtrC family response regulator
LVPSVLLVQDGGPTPAVLSALARYGYRTLVAGGAHSGLAIAGRRELLAVVSTYRLCNRSGVWLFEELKALQPTAMRILAYDDPRLDVDRLVTAGVCHRVVGFPIVPSLLIDVLAGVPETAAVDRTPIVSLPP